MGYAADHKQTTRKRIIERAARLFRHYGYQGVGIDDIMAAAGLTRGGFYAHFKSKQDLFAAALSSELELAARLDGRAGAGRSRDAQPAKVLADFYLDPGTRTQALARCPLVSLSTDVARVGAEASAAYTATVRALLAEIERRVANGGADARGRALAALALCVGGAVLAQAIDDESLAGALLAACRERTAVELEHGRAPHRGA